MAGIGFIVLASLVWAIDALIRYPLLNMGVGAGQIVLIEHLVLALVFLPFAFKSRHKIWQSKFSHLTYFLIVGGFGSALATLSFTKAFALMNPSLVILLQKLQPLVAIILSFLVLKEPIQKKFILWAGVCLIGGLLISHEQIIPGTSGGGSIVGVVLALIAVFGWGSATVFGKKLGLEGYSEFEIMCGRFIFGLVCLIPWASADILNMSGGAPTLGKILLMAFLSGVLAMYLYYSGLKRVPARVATLAEMFFPFCAVIVNWVVLGASLDPIQITGGLLLLLGSSVIQLKHY